MKRYEIVLEAEDGIELKCFEGVNGEIIIRAIYENDDPPIPKGYRHLCGEKKNGFVIERCSDHSEFLWIPVADLEANGIIDKDFSTQFGRRNYMNDDFSENGFREKINPNYMETVQKYGGFYISRFFISKNPRNEKPQSLKEANPLVNISFQEAKKMAASFETGSNIKSHLTHGAELDSVYQWFINSNQKSKEDLVCKAEYVIREKPYFVNNFSIFPGMEEWTQEQYGGNYRVTRGGIRGIVKRNYAFPGRGYDNTGFRVSLYIK